MSKSKRKSLNILGAIVTVLIAIVSIFAFASAVFCVVYSPNYVVGYSMKPTLNSAVENAEIDGDLIYVNRFKNFKLNDIVVVKVNGWLKDSVVKRLVGTPGDVIEIVDLRATQTPENNYALIVNDEILYKKEINHNSSAHYELYKLFVNNEILDKDFSNNITQDKKIVLNENEYFLMGDNWGNSTDSLVNGVVKKSKIEGKVDFIIPYKQNRILGIFKQITKALFTKNN